MSNPTDGDQPDPGDQPDVTRAAGPEATGDAPASPTADDAQPTEAYPAGFGQTDASYPEDAQPTEAYPAGYGQPAQPAYDPAYAGAAQAPQGQPGYGAPMPPAYGAPAPPSGPDTRPKTFGWISLGLSVAGLVLVLVAFIPLLWVSLVLTLVGGLLLLVGLILGIVTLANKKQGGKPLGIGAIIVSVLGGIAWVIALFFSLVLIGLATAADSATPMPESSMVEQSPAPVPDESMDTDADGGDAQTDGGDTDGGETDDGTATGAYDEAAYIAEVRPALTSIMQEVEPGITEDDLASFFPDETLVAMGQALLLGGDMGRDAFVDSMSEASGGLFTDDQATRFYDTILSSAQAHLVE